MCEGDAGACVAGHPYTVVSHMRYSVMRHFPAVLRVRGWVYCVLTVALRLICHQVAIGETTFDGIASLASQPGAIIDYYSLIWLALQRR